RQLHLQALRKMSFSDPVTVGEAARDVILRLGASKVLRLRGRVVNALDVPIKKSTAYGMRLTDWERGLGDLSADGEVAVLSGAVRPRGAPCTEFLQGELLRDSSEYCVELSAAFSPNVSPTAIAFVARNRVLAVLALDAATLSPSDEPKDLPDLVVDPSLLP